MAWLESEGRALDPDLVLFASCHNDYSDSDGADPDWIGHTPSQRRLRRLLMSPALAQLLRALLLPPPRDPGLPARQRPEFRVSVVQRRVALDRVREVCREEGIPLALVLMPQGLRPWPADTYIADFRLFAQENGLPLADGQKAAEESERWRDLFPPGDIVHPTAEGQQAVARAVADLLRAQRLIPSR
jgi:lysophospholipase L1-like esterase